MAKAIAEPQNARSRRTCAALLAATRELLEEQGFEALTMAAVAARAGVSRRAVYLHFASRTALLTALFSYLGEREDIAGSLRRVWEAPDAAAALQEWAWHLARIHPRLLPVSRAVDRVRRSDPDAAALWDRSMSNWHTGCRRLVAWLDQEGRLAPPWTVDTAADMLWALMSFDVLEGLLVDRHWSPDHYAEHLAVLFRKTFVRDPATSS
ncbi:MAG TPA: helix-turn-helix domain-containing protein [Actinomycetes bacterium]|nr:helix-turn-helix domain-containing protein [Actinomycetes bacterium]